MSHSRRHFLGAAAGVAGALAAQSPNDRICIALIGGGGQGSGDARTSLDAVRTRRPVVEDPVFGFRAAGPALLSNLSYFERRVCLWDPETMTLRGA